MPEPFILVTVCEGADRGMLKTRNRVGITSLNTSEMINTILLAVLKFLSTVAGAL
jgi:hypothetical protein